MLINDPVYGNIEINEPVIESLINSQTLARTKKIQQFGMPPELDSPRLKGFTRYDHNVGVMLLLRKLGASLEEQIAGLLHDTTHFAFSHVVDWVLGSTNKEDGHEKHHERILKSSDASTILSNHGFDINSAVKLEDYHLLDRESPDLCADRVDYALQEFHSWANSSLIPELVNDLIVHDGKIVFRSKGTAKLFAQHFLKLQTEHWGASEPMVRYHHFSQMLKTAIEKEILSIDDFFIHDEHVMGKLRSSGDSGVTSVLNLLSKPIRYELDDANPDVRMKKKFRFVDPEYLENGILQQLNESDDEYRTALQEARGLNERGVNVRFLNND